jgi:hypothetical protein
MVAVDRKAAQLQQVLLVDAVRQAGNGVCRALGGNFGLAPRVVERAAGGDGGQDGVEMLFVALLDAVAHQFALCRRAVFHQVDQRQRRLAFAQIVAHVLANRGGVSRIVEHVVDQLEGGAQRAAVFARGQDVGVAGGYRIAVEARAAGVGAVIG